MPTPFFTPEFYPDKTMLKIHLFRINYIKNGVKYFTKPFHILMK